MKKIFGFVATALVFAGCSSSNDEIPTPQPENKVIKVTASLPQDTKATTRVVYTDGITGKGDGANGTITTAWEASDNISYYLVSNSESPTAYYSSTTGTLTDGKKTFTLDQTPITGSYLYCYTGDNFRATGSGTLSYITANATGSPCKLYFKNKISGIYTDINGSKFKAANIYLGSSQYTSGTSMDVQFSSIFAVLKLFIKVPIESGLTSLTKVQLNHKDGGKVRDVGDKDDSYIEITGGATPTITWGTLTGGSINLRDGAISVTDTGSGYNELTLYALIAPQTFNGLKIQVTGNNAKTYSYTSAAEDGVALQAGKWYSVKAKLTAD